MFFSFSIPKVVSGETECSTEREQSVVPSAASLLNTMCPVGVRRAGLKLHLKVTVFSVLGPVHLLKLHPVVKYKYVVWEHLEMIGLTYFEGDVPVS